MNHKLGLYVICKNHEPESKDRTDSVTTSVPDLIGDFLRGIWGLLLVKNYLCKHNNITKLKPEVWKVFCSITNSVFTLFSRIKFPSFKFRVCWWSPGYETIPTSAATSYFGWWRRGCVSLNWFLCRSRSRRNCRKEDGLLRHGPQFYGLAPLG